MKAIFATDEAGGFGLNGRLPWPKIKEDLNHFRKITSNNYVIMGYNTWKTIPELPYRIPVIITKNNIEGGHCVPQKDYITHLCAFEKFLYEGDSGKDVIVIGGSKILSPELIKACDEVFHTTVKGTYDCDTVINPETLKVLENLSSEVILDTDSCTIRRYYA